MFLSTASTSVMILRSSVPPVTRELCTFLLLKTQNSTAGLRKASFVIISLLLVSENSCVRSNYSWNGTEDWTSCQGFPFSSLYFLLLYVVPHGTYRISAPKCVVCKAIHDNKGFLFYSICTLVICLFCPLGLRVWVRLALWLVSMLTASGL